MCLFSNNRLPRLTTEDIKVYKVVKVTKDGFISPYRLYKLSENNTEKLFPLVSNSEGIVNGGYIHSFTDQDKAIDTKDRLMRRYEIYGEVYTTIECIIPKHTIYFNGNRSDICSKRLIIPNYDRILRNKLKKSR